MSHYVCITGGRDYTDEVWMRQIIQILHWIYEDDLRIMHGDSRGADRLAAKVAKSLGIPVRAFPADWDGLGKKAGVLRNAKMADLLQKWATEGHTVQVVAFPGGTGTNDMMIRADQRGISLSQV